MNIFWFVIGICVGLGFKLAADWYAQWTAEQKDLRDKMDAWVRRLDAIEELKNSLPGQKDNGRSGSALDNV